MVAWPLAARAQKSAVPVIGFLRSTTAAGSEHLAAAFEQGLKDAGFIEGQNVAIDYTDFATQLERAIERSRQPLPLPAPTIEHEPTVSAEEMGNPYRDLGDGEEKAAPIAEGGLV